MKAKEESIIIEQGSDFTLKLEYKDGLTPVDINGYTPYFRMFYQKAGSDSLYYGDDSLQLIDYVVVTPAVEAVEATGSAPAVVGVPAVMGIKDGVSSEGLYTHSVREDLLSTSVVATGVTTIDTSVWANVSSEDVAPLVFGTGTSSDTKNVITTNSHTRVEYTMLDNTIVESIFRVGTLGVYSIAIDKNVTAMLNTRIKNGDRDKFATKFNYVYHIGLTKGTEDIRTYRGKCSVRV